MKSFGNLGIVSPSLFAGWAVIEEQEIVPEIVIFVDDLELCRTKACKFRKDLLDQKNHSTGYCGFEVRDFHRTALEKGRVVRAFIEQTGVELNNSPYYLKGKMSQRSKVDIEPIVFIHIPKTAGTSFRIAAEQRLGSSTILKDYGSQSVETSTVIKNTVYQKKKHLLVNEIINNKINFLTGHFHAVAYLDIFDSHVKWCTFLRNPVQRVISEYYHFVRHNNYHKSLEEFCNEPMHCNRQTQLISGLKLEDFYFVGLTEYYQESIGVFNQLSNLNFPYLQKNKARQSLTDKYKLDPKLLGRIESNNERDFELYERAKKLLNELITQLDRSHENRITILKNSLHE